VQELTSLIAAQRAYDMNSKVISASDQMMATVTQPGSRLTALNLARDYLS
jgi:flagellar basal body rod protein FlgG